MSSTSSTARRPATSSGRTSSTHDESEWRRLGKDIRDLCGEDPDIVFEHPGRSTFAASMYVAKRGGTVVACAATSGFMLEFDNRHFWMRLKRLVGSHFANYKEAWEANRLISKGMIHPVMSQVFALEQTGEAAYQVHHNMHEGKIGVLCARAHGGPRRHRPRAARALGDKLHAFRRAVMPALDGVTRHEHEPRGVTSSADRVGRHPQRRCVERRGRHFHTAVTVVSSSCSC